MLSIQRISSTKSLNTPKGIFIPSLLLHLITLLLQILLTDQIYGKPAWFREESSHYFTDDFAWNPFNADARYVYDLMSVDGRTYNIFPFNFILNYIQDDTLFSFSGEKFYFALFWFVIYLTTFAFFGMFMQSLIARYISTMIFTLSFVSMNAAMYGSKTFAYVYLVSSVLISSDKKFCRSRRSLLFWGLVITFFCTGMLSNLGASITSFIVSFLLVLAIHGMKSMCFTRYLLFSISSVIYALVFTFFAYFRNDFITILRDYVPVSSSKFHFDGHVFFGGGSWSQFDQYADILYNPWFPTRLSSELALIYFSTACLALISQMKFKALMQKVKSHNLAVNQVEIIDCAKPKAKRIAFFALALFLLISLPEEVNPIAIMIDYFPQIFSLWREPWSKLYMPAFLLSIFLIFRTLDVTWIKLQAYYHAGMKRNSSSKLGPKSMKIIKRVKLTLISLLSINVVLVLTVYTSFYHWNYSRSNIEKSPYLLSSTNRTILLKEIREISMSVKNNPEKLFIVCSQSTDPLFDVYAENLWTISLGASKGRIEAPFYNNFIGCAPAKSLFAESILNKCEVSTDSSSKYYKIFDGNCLPYDLINGLNSDFLNGLSVINGRNYS